MLTVNVKTRFRPCCVKESLLILSGKQPGELTCKYTEEYRDALCTHDDRV